MSLLLSAATCISLTHARTYGGIARGSGGEGGIGGGIDQLLLLFAVTHHVISSQAAAEAPLPYAHATKANGRREASPPEVKQVQY